MLQQTSISDRWGKIGKHHPIRKYGRPEDHRCRQRRKCLATVGMPADVDCRERCENIILIQYDALAIATGRTRLESAVEKELNAPFAAQKSTPDCYARYGTECSRTPLRSPPEKKTPETRPKPRSSEETSKKMHTPGCPSGPHAKRSGLLKLHSTSFGSHAFPIVRAGF